MKNRTLLIRLFAVVAAMMCALGASAAEAYACYTPSNTTLTFYYDNLRSSRTGSTYSLNTGENNPGWKTDGTNANVNTVVFDPSFADARPTTTYAWFYEMENLQSITGISYLNTSNVTNMWAMFAYCNNLTSLNLTSFNTAKVTDMTGMFYFCNFLARIYVGENWTTEAVTFSNNMFLNCTSLVGGQGTSYDANHVDKTYAHIDFGPSNPGYFTADPNAPAPTTAYACYMPSNTTLTFYYDNLRSSRTGSTYSLNSGENNPGWNTDGTNANVTKVVFDPSFANARPTTTYKWFSDMENLQSITGISYLNTSEVTNMVYMFNNCRGLTSLDVSNFNTTKVTSMSVMFQGCKNLTSLDLRSFNTANVTSMSWMFNVCDVLTSLDLSSFNTAKVTNMNSMFRNCDNLSTIYVGDNWTTAAVTSSEEMFEYCFSIEGGQGTTYDASHVDAEYAHIDGGPSNPGYFTDHNASAITIPYACYTPSNTTLTFYYDDQRFTRSGTTYGLNTGNNEPRWESDGTSANVTKVVFDPSFADARPTTTCAWFYNMQNLQSITGFSYLNTSEVTDMRYMFYNCESLTSLDVSSFNTANVTIMALMFRNCPSLTSLDLSSFNTANVTYMNRMFQECTNLRTIYVGENWTTAALIESPDMFKDCTSLVGGQGTTYDANHTDGAYAHIDGGPRDPGYFTADSTVPVATTAYACYTSSNTTLTFYYDDQRSSRPGMIYSLNTGTNDTGWETDGTNASVTSVVFDPSFADARPKTTYAWFYNMENLQSITGISYLNTSEVTNMAYMFDYCESLTSLDVSHFNTANVTDMTRMFYTCSALKSLDLSHFNTANVTSMYAMFAWCTDLKSLDLSHFNTANVTSMYAMFLRCSNLTSLDVTSFNTAKVISMKWMFQECTNLQTIYVGDGWSTKAVLVSDNMFKNCTSLVGSMGTTYDADHVDKTYAHIDGGPSNPGYFTAEGTEPYACYTPSNTTLTFYYDTERSTRPGTTYDLNSGNNKPDWYTDNTYRNVSTVVFDPLFAAARPTSTYWWFSNMGNLSSIEGIEYLNTSKVTNMSRMFSTCWSMESFDLSHFDTGNVRDMSFMFNYCEALTSLDLSSFDTGNVLDMEGMFYECSSLTSLDVSSFNTENVHNFKEMFNDCASLTSMDLSNFDTRNAESMNGMFLDCSGLTSIDLSSFNTEHVVDMSSMFAYCSGLTSLDLSSFNTSYLLLTNWMFSNCRNLVTVNVGDEWNANSLDDSEGMFQGCTSLVGGKGTTYDANHVDAEYAHIDRGPSNPGYFTGTPKPYACYTPSNTTLTFYYDDQRSSRPGTTYDLNTGTNDTGWETDGINASVTKVVFDPSFADARPTTTCAWFNYMENLQSITGISFLNTSEVTNMDFMFNECRGLTSLDLSSFNTTKATSMGAMFQDCESLTSVDLRSFNTANVIDIGWMFYGCSSLTSLDLSSFNTAKVTDMRSMFVNCSNLTSLDLTTFNTANVTLMNKMFYACDQLATIYVGDAWSTAAVTKSSDMFENCTNLVGGKGTTYDANHVDAEYAHIDGGPSNPGYFTAAFLRGDVNNNGVVNISDVTDLIDYLLSGDASTINQAAADCNQDGSINIADVTALIDHLLSGTWE